VQSWIKGVIVGIAASSSIAAAMGLSIAYGLRTSTPIGKQPTAGEAVAALLALGIPSAVAFAVMVARLETPGFGPRARTFIFVVIALLFLTLCLPFWPDLATCGIPITILHAIALARWTAPRVIALPKAIVW
jgi:TctA family transporter